MARKINLAKLTPGARWEHGIAHDPRSIEIFQEIAKIDFAENGDQFCWKSGGDGDNGENLMYLLDCYFGRLPSGPWYVEEKRDGSKSFTRCATGHMWDLKKDARQQMKELRVRFPKRTYRLKLAPTE